MNMWETLLPENAILGTLGLELLNINMPEILAHPHALNVRNIHLVWYFVANSNQMNIPIVHKWSIKVMMVIPCDLSSDYGIHWYTTFTTR